MKLDNDNCLVLLSGGQDSTTCLFWALNNFNEVNALFINYKQRHRIEEESAFKIANLAGVPIGLICTDIIADIGDSALVMTGDILSKHRSGDLPASFVPGRNILFLTIAAMYAYKLGIHNIVAGVCETDYSGYPDCRQKTIDSVQNTLNLGMEYDFVIHTPLMYKTKCETVIMASLLSGCWDALAWSHTCYEGKIPPCGKCPSCVLRARGFEEAGYEDPLIKRLGIK